MSQTMTSTGQGGSSELTGQIPLGPPPPYKGLNAFSESERDAQFFFGREAERDIVTAMLMTARLSMLCGASGVGKTSLLEAGVTHQLRRRAFATLRESDAPEFVVVVFRSWADCPAAALAAQIRSDVVSAFGGRQVSPPPADGSLTDTLQWTNSLDIDLLVILDQFEEFFLYQPTQADHDSFLEEWVRAVNQKDLNVNFLISIHDNFLSNLYQFKGEMPPPFANSYKLEHLDFEAARAAIVKPIERFDQLFGHKQVPHTIEPSCIDALLEQVRERLFTLDGTKVVTFHELRTPRLGGPRVETPYLQLVMTRLWEEEQRLGSRVLRRETLDRLGGARMIITTLWKNVLSKLRLGQRPMAARMLRALVTPSGTKIGLTLDDLALVAERPAAQVQPVADLLVREKVLRLLAPIDRPGLRRYELYHNILARPILDWCRDQFTLLKFAKRLAAWVAAALAVGILVLILMNQRFRSQRDAALSLLSIDPEQSLKKAVASAHHWPQPEAESALRVALSVPQPVGKMPPHERGVNVASFNKDHDNPLLLTAGADGLAKLFKFGGEKEQFVGEKLQLKVEFPARAASHESLEPILAAMLSPNGKLVVTGHRDGTARLWQSSDGKLSATILVAEGTSNLSAPANREKEHYEKAVNAVAFSPDGEFVAAGYRDGTARLWRSSVRGLIEPPPLSDGHKASVNAVVFSPPDSKKLVKLVTASDDLTAILWDVPSGKKGPVLTGHSGPICTAASSPDGRFVVIGGGTLSRFEDREKTGKSFPQGILHVYDANSGELEQDLPSPPARVSTIAFSDDGLLMLGACYDGTLWLWNTLTWRIIDVLRGHTGPILGAAFSHDGSRAVTASVDETTRLWDTGTGECLTVLKAHKGPVYSASFSPDDRLIVTASRDGDALTWSSRKFPILFERGKTDKSETLEKGKIDKSKPRDLKDHHESWILSAAFSPDGNYFATTSYDCTARIWKVSSGHVVAVLDRYPDVRDGHNGPVTAVAFAPDHDSRRVVTACYDGKARVWEWDDTPGSVQVVEVLKKHEDHVTHKGHVTGVTYSRNGERIATHGDDNTTRIWEKDPKTGSFHWVADLRDHTTRLTPSVFTQNGKRIVTVTEATQAADRQLSSSTTRGTGTVKIWDGHSGKPIPIRGLTESPNLPVTDAVFNNSGTLLAITNVEGKAWVLGLPRGKIVAEFPKDTRGPGHTASIDRAVFLQDDYRLATDGWDGSIKIWNIDKKTLEATLQGTTGLYSLLRSSPKFPLLLAESGGGRCTVWDLEGKPIRLAEFRHREAVSASAISSDGRYAVSAARDGSFLIINLLAKPKPEIQAVPRGPRTKLHESPILDVAFSPDGKILATAGTDGAVKLWESETGRLIDQPLESHCGPVNVVALSPIVKPKPDVARDSAFWLASGGIDGKVKVWAIKEKNATEENSIEKQPELAIEKLSELDCGSPVTIVRFSPDDGSQLLAASREAHTAYLWTDISKKKDPVLLDHRESVRAAVFSPQGNLIVTAGGEAPTPAHTPAIAKVWKLESSREPKELFTLEGHEDHPDPEKIVRATVDLTDWRDLRTPWGIKTAEFSSDGELIVTAADDGTARVWDANTGKPFTPFGVLGEEEADRHEASVLCAAFSHDGRKIITASQDNTAKVWDIGKKPAIELHGHLHGVSRAEFGPKDKIILTLSNRGGTARIWDAATGRSLAILPSDGDGPVVAATISPKGHYLLLVHREGKILLHKLEISGDLGDLLKSAKDRKDHMKNE